MASVGKEALVFASPIMLKALSLATEVHIDATFKTVPALFTQLMTINVISSNYVSFNYIFLLNCFSFILKLINLQSFPVAFVLMSGKTQEPYELATNHVLLAVEARYVRPNIRLMVSDYEIAILEAMETCFPGGRARGCYFHYGQVLFHIQIRFFNSFTNHVF